MASINASTSGAGGLITTGDASGALDIQTAGTTAISITSGQNVGIGIASPTAKLHVRGAYTGGQILADATSGERYTGLSLLNNGTLKFQVYYDTTNIGAEYYMGAGTGYQKWFTGGVERMILNSNGDVGIGTSSPNYKLDVRGTAASTGTLYAVGNASSPAGIIHLFGVGGISNGYYIEKDGVNNVTHIWANQASEIMRAQSTSNLLIGTQTQLGSVGRVQIGQSNPSVAGLSVDVTNASYDYNAIYINAVRAASSAFNFIQATTSSYGDTRFRVRGDGNVYNTTGVYSTISDVKLKENITDASSKLEKLNQVRVVNYNLKDDELKQIGFVAQELEKVFPSLVEDNADKDVDGKDLGTTTKSVKLTVFIPILVKAIQELNAKVTALEAQLENK